MDHLSSLPDFQPIVASGSLEESLDICVIGTRRYITCLQRPYDSIHSKLSRSLSLHAEARFPTTVHTTGHSPNSRSGDRTRERLPARFGMMDPR